MAERAPRLLLWPKRILYTAYGILAVYVVRAADLSWLHVLLCLLPLLVAEGVLRLILNQKIPRFEQELMARMQKGKEGELLTFIRSQKLLALAAPRYYLQSKLGLIYRQLGQNQAAATALRDALEEAPAPKRFALVLGLADSLYEIGEHREAERLYRIALDEEHTNARACANLSRLILLRGGDPEEAEAYLRLAVDASRGGKLRCELIQLLLKLGKTEEAQEELRRAEEEMASAPEEDRQMLLEARVTVVAAETNSKLPESPE